MRHRDFDPDQPWVQLIQDGPQEAQSVEEWSREVATEFTENRGERPETTIPVIQEVVQEYYEAMTIAQEADEWCQ